MSAMMSWEREDEIYGEAAAYVTADQVYDLTVTSMAAGGVEADVVTDHVIWREWFPTVESAKRAVERAVIAIAG